MKILVMGIVLIVLVNLTMTGCCGSCADKIAQTASERISEEIAEQITGEEVDIEDGRVVIEGEDGSVSEINEDGVDLDEYDFSYDEVLYPDAKCISYSDIGDNDYEQYSITLETEDSKEDIFDYYKGLDGWEKISEAVESKGGMITLLKDESQQLTVIISEEGDLTQIGIIFGKNN